MSTMEMDGRGIRSERKEEMLFTMEMDGPTAHRLKDAFRKVAKVDPAAGANHPGDTVSLSYRFTIDYYDGCADAIEGILTLVKDESVVSKIDLKELQHSRCLLVEMVRNIQKIERRLLKQQKQQNK